MGSWNVEIRKFFIFFRVFSKSNDVSLSSKMTPEKDFGRKITKFVTVMVSYCEIISIEEKLNLISITNHKKKIRTVVGN